MAGKATQTGPDLFEQPPNYHGRPPFAAGSETSEAAADAMHGGRSQRQRRLVLDKIDEGGLTGRTQDEVSFLLALPAQSVCPRIKELCLLGHVVRTTMKRDTRSGRKAFIYVTKYHYERLTALGHDF